ncbi:MAG: hypothetical protein IJ491_03630 [Clostridia bacterium]|nr:hypothetical protein [Clostridia bacterium]
MVDAREQIKNLLEGIIYNEPFKVSSQYPQSNCEGIKITYNEILNTQTSVSVVDEIAFQVDVWTYDLESLVTLTHLASDALTGIGLKRQFTSPDFTPAETKSKYFRKTMRFGRKVDTRTNRLID